ncbi:MAG TPA: penicillin-binding protein 1C [Dongiaceae bacterium]|nr:penicillin-binding protein 1C [Dongiaceae bacterium]
MNTRQQDHVFSNAHRSPQWRTVLRTLVASRLRVVLSAIALTVVLLLVLDKLFPLNLPEDDSLFARVVTDSSGRPLRAFPDPRGVWRYPIQLEDVSPLYVEALLTYEDRSFWHHPGVNPLALTRAALQATLNGHVVSGGSTISMQVARLLHPHARTVPGKAYQILRTLQLEWHLSKREILQLYLNIAPFGGTVEGVQAAAYAYLDKPASALTHGEAALLAVLPQSPTRIRPDRNPERAQVARDKVLDRMEKLSVWDARTVMDAKQETVYASSLRPPQHAPLLAETLVQRHRDARLIRSTIDGDLQLNLEDYVARYRNVLPEQSSLAVLVVDNRDMRVRAYVGAADFGNQSRFGYLDMVQAIRSPGSTLKPFLFALALEQGLIHSESLLLDAPRSGSDYRPGNFSGGFSGPVSATEALQRSLNVPAVDLLEQLGPQQFAARLQQGGLKLTIPGDQKPGLAVILGGAGATLEQLVTVYSALARNGQSAPLRYREDDPLRERFMLDPGAAWIVWKMLQSAPRPDRLHTLHQTLGQLPIAWKTGTSYGFRDAWSIGVSTHYSVGVWVGRPDGTPMPGHFGAETAAPLMFDIFQQIDRNGGTEPEQPSSVSQRAICWPLGTDNARNTPAQCEQQRVAWVLHDTVPPTAHGGRNPLPLWVDTVTGLRVTPLCDGVQAQARDIVLWPAAIEPWLPGSARRAQRIPPLDARCHEDQPLLLPAPRILGLEDNSRLTALDVDALPTVDLSVTGGVGQLQWYINGEYKFSSKPNQNVRHRFAGPGRYEIVVVDEQGQTDRRRVKVEGADLAYH